MTVLTITALTAIHYGESAPAVSVGHIEALKKLLKPIVLLMFPLKAANAGQSIIEFYWDKK
jgi:hypothetical protein